MARAPAHNPLAWMEHEPVTEQAKLGRLVARQERLISALARSRSCSNQRFLRAQLLSACQQTHSNVLEQNIAIERLNEASAATGAAELLAPPLRSR
ncbi:hypothetical protein ABPG75_002302 [Micractinium tetrahymenae]